MVWFPFVNLDNRPSPGQHQPKVHTAKNLSKTEAPYFAEEILGLDSAKSEVLFGSIWFGFGMVWHGLVWFGMVRRG